MCGSCRKYRSDSINIIGVLPMPVAALYRKDETHTWKLITDLNLSTQASTEIASILTNLELDYSPQNVASKGVDLILQAYKYDDDHSLVVGINDYDMKIVKYTLGPFTDPTDEVDLFHNVRVHQWAPNLLQVNPSI